MKKPPERSSWCAQCTVILSTYFHYFLGLSFNFAETTKTVARRCFSSPKRNSLSVDSYFNLQSHFSLNTGEESLVFFCFFFLHYSRDWVIPHSGSDLTRWSAIQRGITRSVCLKVLVYQDAFLWCKCLMLPLEHDWFKADVSAVLNMKPVFSMYDT